MNPATAIAGGQHLIEARPHPGRTHQIRVHLAAAGCPISGDDLYGEGGREPLGLRAVGLAYRDPFTHTEVGIRAAGDPFLETHGFAVGNYRVAFESIRPRTPRPPPSHGAGGAGELGRLPSRPSSRRDSAGD